MAAKPPEGRLEYALDEETGFLRRDALYCSPREQGTNLRPPQLLRAPRCRQGCPGLARSLHEHRQRPGRPDRQAGAAEVDHVAQTAPGVASSDAELQPKPELAAGRQHALDRGLPVVSTPEHAVPVTRRKDPPSPFPHPGFFAEATFSPGRGHLLRNFPRYPPLCSRVLRGLQTPLGAPIYPFPPRYEMISHASHTTISPQITNAFCGFKKGPNRGPVFNLLEARLPAGARDSLTPTPPKAPGRQLSFRDARGSRALQAQLGSWLAPARSPHPHPELSCPGPEDERPAETGWMEQGFPGQTTQSHAYPE